MTHRAADETTVIFMRAYTQPSGRHRKAGEYARLPRAEASELERAGIVSVREPHEPQETKERRVD